MRGDGRQLALLVGERWEELLEEHEGTREMLLLTNLFSWWE